MAKNPTAKKTSPSKAADKIPIHFNNPVDKASVYATNIIIQPGEYEMVLTFFEVQPPLLLGSQEENIALLRSAGVRADCVAKITVSKERFEGFADAMKNMAGELKEAMKQKQK